MRELRFEIHWQPSQNEEPNHDNLIKDLAKVIESRRLLITVIKCVQYALCRLVVAWIHGRIKLCRSNGTVVNDQLPSLGSYAGNRRPAS